MGPDRYGLGKGFWAYQVPWCNHGHAYRKCNFDSVFLLLLCGISIYILILEISMMTWRFHAGHPTWDTIPYDCGKSVVADVAPVSDLYHYFILFLIFVILFNQTWKERDRERERERERIVAGYICVVGVEVFRRLYLRDEVLCIETF